MGALSQPEALLASGRYRYLHDPDRHSGLSLSKKPVRPALSVRIQVLELMYIHVPCLCKQQGRVEQSAPKSRHTALCSRLWCLYVCQTKPFLEFLLMCIDVLGISVLCLIMRLLSTCTRMC